MATKLQIRRDTLNNWYLINPVLAEGEIGFVIDTNKIKIGDGKKKWEDLDYIVSDSCDVEYLLQQVELIENELELKANKEDVYTKEEADALFIDMTELDDKAQYIINEVIGKVYTKEEADAMFASECQLGELESDFNDKFNSLEDIYAKKVNVYTKSEIDEKLDEIKTETSVKGGKGIYITKEENHDVINVNMMDLVQDSTDIKFEHDNGTGKVQAKLNIQVYTKSEVDDKFATKDELNEVNNVVISTKSEVDKIKETLKDVDFTRVIQLDENTFANLTNGDIVQWENGHWVIGNVGSIRVWED